VRAPHSSPALPCPPFDPPSYSRSGLLLVLGDSGDCVSSTIICTEAIAISRGACIVCTRISDCHFTSCLNGKRLCSKGAIVRNVLGLIWVDNIFFSCAISSSI
jgi:hypothetical protein